jgi:hypothetical protein
LQDPPELTQIGIFGLKTNHLAALLLGNFYVRECPLKPNQSYQFGCLSAPFKNFEENVEF